MSLAGNCIENSLCFCIGEEPIAYQFEWTVKNEPTGNDYRQQETRNGQLTTGLYQVLLPDGRYQVTYPWLS